MVDVLKLMDEHVRVTGVGGRRLRMSEAAVEIDPVAYLKLTDSFVETRLVDGEDPALEAAAAEYESRIVRRELMRFVGSCDLPRTAEEGAPVGLRAPKEELVIQSVYDIYMRRAQEA